MQYSKINSYFEQANLPKYNVTYLKEDLRKHRNILSIKGGGYKPTRTLLLELDAEFNQFLLKTEEVVCEGLILPTSLYENTRGYIETLGKQINASYEHNIYDGCSVLMRRLLEILLIHSYEATGNITVIQDGDGYKNLSVIINDIIQHKRFLFPKRYYLYLTDLECQETYRLIKFNIMQKGVHRRSNNIIQSCY